MEAVQGQIYPLIVRDQLVAITQTGRCDMANTFIKHQLQNFNVGKPWLFLEFVNDIIKWSCFKESCTVLFCLRFLFPSLFDDFLMNTYTYY